MKKIVAVLALVCFAVPALRAAILTQIPGVMAQGDMIMPVIELDGFNLTLQMPSDPPPLLASLERWSMGNTFDPSAAWYARLDPVGGAGDLFNNQYGFTFEGIIPGGTGVGIRLLSASPGLQSWNYVRDQNRFDLIFSEVGDQVLWDRSMWHNYFTMPADTAPGIYSASFEIFITNTTFTGGTGAADYSEAAINAIRNDDYGTVTITYTWEVVPEPSTYFLVAVGLALLGYVRFRRARASS